MTLVDQMCEARFALLSIAMPGDLTTATVPAGTSSPAGKRELDDVVCGYAD
jgi:hypothetical protein